MKGSQPSHRVATRKEWQEVQTRLLEREYEIRRMSEELGRERRNQPWVLLDKEYTFDTQAGEKTLADLFEGRSQLLVYHMMFGPEWTAGCPACSSVVDPLDGAMPHLNQHDATMVVCSHAPLEKLAAYKKRMGWKLNYVSSLGSTFNYDFGVSYTKGQQDDLDPNLIEQLTRAVRGALHAHLPGAARANREGIRRIRDAAAPRRVLIRSRSHVERRDGKIRRLESPGRFGAGMAAHSRGTHSRKQACVALGQPGDLGSSSFAGDRSKCERVLRPPDCRVDGQPQRSPGKRRDRGRNRLSEPDRR